jgi:uracil-DNA glycosylase family 4
LPDTDQFLSTYLREIGVHTPVTIVCSEKEPIAVSKVIPETNPPESNSLNELSAKASDCRLCGLAETRNKVVFGIGNPHADLVFIGEAPGIDEDIKGEPFVGHAGQLLDRMLGGIGLDREQVYIMNTIKCHPPNNRDPRVEEVQACNLWFEQQLDMLAPKVICLLGRVAAQTVLQTDATLGSLRGRWHDYNGIPVWVTYHPAYLLRSPQQKEHSWQDLLTLSGRLQ